MNTDINQFTNILFYPRPEQWGLRGDPMLWTDFENHVRQWQNIPKSVEDFRQELKNLFEELVGPSLEKGAKTFVEKYKHVGMSSGVVSADFWLDTAFPLLSERFETVKVNQS
jgi:hypothetical protein